MSADECSEFLLAVVNAHDRSTRAGLRKRFNTQYRQWFPDDMQGEGAESALKAILYAHSIPHVWWCAKSLEEKPETEFGLNVNILRDRLRFIWGVSRREALVRDRLYSLRNDVVRYRRAGNSGDKEWRRRTLAALSWLGENLKRLLVCQNPECSEDTHYCFRDWNNKKYCSTACSERGHELKREERQKQVPEKKYKKSDETRRKMALSADKRWKRTKEEEKSKSKTKTSKKPASRSKR